jgi:glycosyltransferase involved in cell wall biosynthesis
MPPCVSVIMPVRDGARWIDEALASVTAQTFADFELVVVDDGSVDSTGAMVSAAAQRDPRVRLIRQPPSGVAAALNRGLDAATGAYVARLDADDRAHPERLARQIEFLEANLAIGMVGSWACIIDESGAIIDRVEPVTTPAALAEILPHRNPMVHSSVMWRAAFGDAVGRYRPALEGAEDYDLWLRMAERGPIANVGAFLVDHRRHASSVSQSNNLRQQFSARLARRAAFARRAHGVDPADSLAAAPDWNAADALMTFYAEDARLYRLLELAVREASPSAEQRTLLMPPAPAHEFAWTHDERRLAQLALLKLMTADAAPHRFFRRLTDFIRLHPPRAAELTMSAIAGRWPGRTMPTGR